VDEASLRAAGWTRHESSDFSAVLGPLWSRGTAGVDRAVGFLADARHVNNRHTVHGGALMTFADIALGWVAADALGHHRCVTAQLALQFVASPRVGEFVFCQAELVRCTSQLAFMRGLITADGRTVASADGIWKALEPRPAA